MLLLPAISRRERPCLFRETWNDSERERHKSSQDRSCYSAQPLRRRHRNPLGLSPVRLIDETAAGSANLLTAQGMLNMRMTFVATAFTLAVLSAGSSAAASAAYKDPLDNQAMSEIKSRFSELIQLANRHDLRALHLMFWQSPSVLLVAKSAIPSEGNWAGVWGSDAVDQKLRDIAASGPVVLTPDFSKLKVVGLTHELAESYAPMNITVSYAGQDGTPKPFLMIINWIKVARDWKIASEIILPVPPAPAVKG
jgi:hypothetical protein